MMTDGTGARGSLSGNRTRHIPVLLNEVVEALSPTTNETYIDGTFGASGYTTEILKTPGVKLFAIDRDPDAIAGGQALIQKFPDRLELIHGPFAQMQELVNAKGVEAVDGVVLDLGVSSMQLDEAERGFSFMQDGPLDMRMAKDGPSAADAVNSLKEVDLANVLYVLGEEKRSRAIAKAIVKARQSETIATTARLADLVIGVLGKRPDQKTHPATRTFQALRLYVNAELEQLAEGLSAAESLLNTGGRLVIVTFHSLEDRIVKRFFQVRAGKTARPSRHMPDLGDTGPEPSFQLLNRKPIVPTDQEMKDNPRARSAKLRAGVRTAAEAFPKDLSQLGLPELP